MDNPSLPTSPAAAISPGEIRSAGTSELTSPGLSQFRELLTKAQEERRALVPEIERAAVASALMTQKRDSWQQGWFLRRLLPGRYSQLREKTEEAVALHLELQEQQSLSRLQTQIDLPDSVRKAFSRLVDAFAIMAKAERKWDTVSRLATDRVRERTMAAHSIDRKPVAFDMGTCELIQSEWKCPHLANANGGDLYLYPGFVLLHISADAFALVDTSEVELRSAVDPFLEEEGLSADTTVVSHVWKKANKDGSPDRRFAGNYQIPVVAYGRLAITSGSGLNEEYMLSNAVAVEQFATCWAEYKREVLASIA